MIGGRRGFFNPRCRDMIDFNATIYGICNFSSVGVQHMNIDFCFFCRYSSTRSENTFQYVLSQILIMKWLYLTWTNTVLIKSLFQKGLRPIKVILQTECFRLLLVITHFLLKRYFTLQIGTPP